MDGKMSDNIKNIVCSECQFPYLDMSVYQPIQLKILVIITEGVDQLLCNLQQSHVEEELEDRVDGKKEINVQHYSIAGHSLVSMISLNLLPSHYGEDEEEVGGEGDDLGVDHGDGDPVIAPQ